ncbi:hypothetical protein L2E82_19881 [Cichorium intybus]|uniref:Uncharacterized protein n=1 Tax=Cichorium intybus TaxID=13427 RepID=A0ACB9DRE3_CICIN|nr:hypothetical protein L2E82_19881 [Cichorium intybus]
MNEGDEDLAREALKRRKSTASKPKNLLANSPLNPTAFSSNPSTGVLPLFPTGSFERMEEEGDVATAFTMARILSNIPISRGGPTILERFYFSDNVLPYFETGIPLLKQRLHQLPHADNVVIAFPDDGAWKRFHKQLDHFAMVR